MLDIVHVANFMSMMIGIGIGRDGLQHEPSAEVTERLQVDREAARRPLAGRDEASSGLDARVVAEEAAEEAEEAKVARAFQDAFGLYRINELDKAEVALTAFAEAYSDHALAPEAMFYAAKALMMLGQMVRAEKKLLELVRAYPATERAAEALLLAGKCQEKLGRVKDARAPISSWSTPSLCPSRRARPT